MSRLDRWFESQATVADVVSTVADASSSGGVDVALNEAAVRRIRILSAS